MLAERAATSGGAGAGAGAGSGQAAAAPGDGEPERFARTFRRPWRPHVAQQPDSLNDIFRGDFGTRDDRWVVRWLHAESHGRRWETVNPLSAWKSCWF